MRCPTGIRTWEQGVRIFWAANMLLREPEAYGSGGCFITPAAILLRVRLFE